MEIQRLSHSCQVRRLTAEDVEPIYELMRHNHIFYQYHPPAVTRESILEDMEALPPGKEYQDKFYIGFFRGDCLTALMDLITDYPEEGTAWIGLFMTDTRCQNRGIGSQIIGECAAALRELGFRKIAIGVDKGNPQSNAFWKKNGFAVTGEERYIRMELAL